MKKASIVPGLLSLVFVALVLCIPHASIAQPPKTDALSEARHSMGATAVGSKVIFAGGIGVNDKFVRTVNIFDKNANTWNNSHTLLQGRYKLVATSLGTKAFFAGGNPTFSTYSDVIDIYDDSNSAQPWSNRTLTGGGRTFLAATFADSKVFFAGGETGNNVYTDAVDIYDNSTDTWTTAMLPGGARGRLAATSLGTQAFFAGGRKSTGRTDVVDIYDASNGEWRQIFLPSGPRDFLVAASVGTKVFFAGGQTNSGLADNIDIYDVGTKDWVSSPPKLSQARFDLCAVTAGDYVFFAGGSLGGTNTTNAIDIYNNATGEWTTATLSVPRNSLSAASAGNNVFVGGGYVSNSVRLTNVVDVFFPLPKITNESFVAVLNRDENLKPSITVDDVSNIGTVNFKSRGISEGDAAFKSSAVEGNGKYEKTFVAADFNDPIGLEYYFEIVDRADRLIPSRKQAAHHYYPEGAPEQVIPNLKAGSSSDSYQLISVPLELTNPSVLTVFKDFPGDQYDNTQWRLFDYGAKNGKRTNREYLDFTTIEVGKGYWLITRQPTTINVGAGSTVHAVQETPAEIDLVAGWNLIGNPYNFNISWEEVMTYNNSPAAVDDKLGVFNRGTDVDESIILKRYQGAFVHSSNAVTLKIPVKRNLDINGRIGSREVDLNQENWQLPLIITDGILTNRLGGIGMNIDATHTGKDKFDGLNFPMLEGLGMFQIEFPHPEVFADFCREVIPTAESYVWEFKLQRGSDKPLTLTWENEAIVDGGQQLFLFDPYSKVMIDMRTNSSYSVPSFANKLQVLFGNLDFINQKMDELLPVFGHPYPNPTINDVAIPFRIPASIGKMAISVKVYDALGRPVATLTDGVFQKGSHNVIWQTNGRSGLYIAEMEAGNMEKKRVKIKVE